MREIFNFCTTMLFFWIVRPVTLYFVIFLTDFGNAQVRATCIGGRAVSGRWPFRKHPLDDSTSRAVGQPGLSASSAENMAYNINSQLY